MKIEKANPSPEALKVLESLQKTARATLERKRRLGHYVVLWRDNKVVMEGDDAPDEESSISDKL